jgi:pimeloyl-ACP methyl ester carboxylesterase
MRKAVAGTDLIHYVIREDLLMQFSQLNNENWAQACANDGEFLQAARHWQGGLVVGIGQEKIGLCLDDGQVSAGLPMGSGVVTYDGSETVWQKVVAAEPERFHNDLMANVAQGCGLQRSGDHVVHAQYYAAIARAVELLRPAGSSQPLRQGDVAKHGHIDMPIGRYVHLNLEGFDHRIYFEEAGQGIPLLMQHTAGCHGSQWRHLFEMPEITSRFRLIAYDLPCHGKSVPPVEKDWWSETYNLEGAFLRSVPIKLAEALGLESPVFMGCSVGGLLALDLAHRHSDIFKAVISVEGALTIDGDIKQYGDLWHPQVNNEYKARLMDGLMAPTSPKAYRKETSFVYASGWPPVFLGDLHYYVQDYDLTDSAHEIDTNEVGVHILSGEYDYSGTSELGQAASAAIKGSTWAEMKGVGHFPMSENPEAFKAYLLPILDRIAG